MGITHFLFIRSIHSIAGDAIRSSGMDCDDRPSVSIEVILSQSIGKWTRSGEGAATSSRNTDVATVGRGECYLVAYCQSGVIIV